MSVVTGERVDEAVLSEIAAGARDRERPAVPVFPEDAIAALERAGVLGWGAQAGPDRPPAAAELDLVRRIAAADGSVGRIVDGHLNAVERLAVQGPAEVHERELPLVAAGRLRAGVWGADPAGGEDERAAVVQGPSGLVLRGVKVFCSGAGGLHRALVVARDGRRDAADGPPLAAWVDAGDRGRWTPPTSACPSSPCRRATRSRARPGACSTRRHARAGRAPSRPPRRSTARAGTSACSCSSTGSTRSSRARGRSA